MRAFIKRGEECLKLLRQVNCAPKGEAYFDEEEWLMESEESFHGVISDTRDSFIFKDARIPSFELPLPYVEIDE